MPVPGARLAGRLVEGAVDVAHERAPGATERAYRTVAVPLMLADPAGAARAVDVRLDATRTRVSEMAARGSVPPAGARRIRRDLARTRTDLDAITPRLPAVQARCLGLRSAAYNDALQSLTTRPVTPGGPAAHVLVHVGAIAAWIGVLLLVLGPVSATLIGLTAGVVTASFVVDARNRKAGRAQLSSLVQALTSADASAAGTTALGIPRLDRERRALLERARKARRLDPRGLAALSSIDTHLDDLLLRLVEDELEADAAHLVKASVERYLPDTLDPFLAMNDAQAKASQDEVADQLSSIEAALADLVRRPSRINPEQQLLRQGEFLRSKFGSSDRT